MEAGTQNATEKKSKTPKTGMQKFLSGFMNFLAMGGILVVIVVIGLIAVLISYLMK